MSIIVILVIAVAFFYKAKKNNQNKYLWSFIGVASFFIGIIVSAMVMAIIDHDIIAREISKTTLWIATVSGILNSFIGWSLLTSRIKETQ